MGVIKNHSIYLDNKTKYDSDNNIVRDVLRGDKCLFRKNIMFKDSANFNYVINTDGIIHIISPAGKGIKVGVFYRKDSNLIFKTFRNPSVHYFYKFQGYGINAVLFDLFRPDYIQIILQSTTNRAFIVDYQSVVDHSVYYDDNPIYEAQRVIPEKILKEVFEYE